MKSFAMPLTAISRSRSPLFAMIIAGMGGLVCVHAAGLSPGGKAMPNSMNLADTYAASCMQAVDFPDPYGEADLKGNAKLPDYCKCFGEKFLERAMKTQPGPAAPPLEQQSKEEFAMRQSCRRQFNLPAPKKS